MKPKTKLQKEIVRLSATLPKITKEQKEWGENACFDGFYVRSRKTNYCLECGGKWKPEKDDGNRVLVHDTCPDCNTRVRHIEGKWDRHAIQYEYWAVLAAKDNRQVVRVMRTRKFMKRNQPAEFWTAEVMQHWVCSEGKVTSLTEYASGMGYYYDNWSFGDGLQVRTPSRGHELRCSIVPFKVHPKRSILPIICRNGFKGRRSFFGCAPHELFQALLTNSKAETLIKANQIPLFKLYMNNKSDINRYWNSIKIAMRNDYIVKDAQSWIDYLEFLRYFGKDLNNADYVCPANFQEAHDYWMIKEQKAREAQNKKDKEEKMLLDQENYEKAKKRYFDLMFKIENKGIVIVPLRSVSEFIEEGKKLHHCVGGYHSKENSLVLSARINGEPIETVEVSLSSFEVVQARGLQNKASKHNKAIVEAVRNNMNLIAERANYKVAS